MFKDKMVSKISNGIIDEMYTLVSDNGAMDIQTGEKCVHTKTLKSLQYY